MIKDFSPRLYQETIFGTAVNYNTLIVLPTGLGKTNIFLMLAAQRLSQHKGSKILLLGPTRPLIDQYYNVFEKHLQVPKEQMTVLTGHVVPQKRHELWKNSTIIFSTPQGLENDIISNKIDLTQVSLLGFDEAHRAVGEYAYSYIAKKYCQEAAFPRIVGLTASPGSDVEKIAEVCKNLYIEELEVRTELDPDVKPYIQPLSIQWITAILPPEMKDVQKLLKSCFDTKMSEIKIHIPSLGSYYTSKKELLGLQAELQNQIAQGERSPEVLRSISLAAEGMKIQHALELLETQGITPLVQYMDRLFADSVVSKVKAVQNLAKDQNFRAAWIRVKSLAEQNVEHPKVPLLADLVKKLCTDGKKIIVFNHYRDCAVKTVELLSKIQGVKAEIFVGQANKNGTGMTQKLQLQTLEKFKAGEFNVLVSSSVGEEGLDIPKVDAVILYEPVPSVIRTIQRRGRTARNEKGSVYILYTKETRDEAYRWSSHHKEKQMYRTLATLKTRLHGVLQKPKQPTLGQYQEKGPIMYTDYREKGNAVVKGLLEKNIDLRLEKLEVGDYILSSRVGVEFKTVHDFAESIIDGRLLTQLRDLKANFIRPLVVVQGNEDIYTVRNIHPNAIRGVLSTIAVSYGIPVLFTKDAKETAELFIAVAKREQDESEGEYNLHGERKPLSLAELQEYIISSLPGVGSALSRPLLEHFKTVKNVINATEQELQNIEKIGPAKSKRITDAVNAEYQKKS